MSQLKILEITRKNILAISEQFTDKQLNFIPEGFNNNLIWNMGHVLVTQQLLCYRLAGENCYSSDEIIDAYRKGSSPQGEVDGNQIVEIKHMLIEMVRHTESDIKAGKFQNYKTYTTSYGAVLESFEGALEFNNVHEGMHLGYMLAMRKLIK